MLRRNESTYQRVQMTLSFGNQGMYLYDGFGKQPLSLNPSPGVVLPNGD